nr:uracil-DNA glycosylase [Novosphingobium sp.]
MTPKSFVAALAEMRLPNVFNPWADRCTIHDRSDAPQRRRANLTSMLNAAIETRAETIWIARDLGYRGGRRTGIPLTDEVHLDEAGRLLGDISYTKATTGPAVAERTAAIVWRMLTRVNQPVMLWNVFPFHPHDANDPMSNRCHSRLERETTWPLLEALIEMLQPRQIVAIGRDAHMALEPLPVDRRAKGTPLAG